jgi:transcriptional regulator with XRE-family HTH domain
MNDIDNPELTKLGADLKLQRKRLGVTAEIAAKASGISRVTLHRIENGSAGTSIGAVYQVASALGLELRLCDRNVHMANDLETEEVVPLKIVIDRYPFLKSLCWHIPNLNVLGAREAHDIYARGGRFLKNQEVSDEELKLMENLSQMFDW